MKETLVKRHGDFRKAWRELVCLATLPDHASSGQVGDG